MMDAGWALTVIRILDGCLFRHSAHHSPACMCRVAIDVGEGDDTREFFGSG